MGIEGNTFEKSGSPISNDIDPDTAIAFNNVSSTDGSNGFGSVRDNIITDYDYGIFAKSTGLVTSGNVIDRVKYGISVCFKFDGKIVARKCTIDNFEEGIILSKLAGAKVSIIDNEIGTLTTTPVTSSDGIVISGNNTVLHDMTVRRNNIREFTDHGIIAYGTNTLKIWDNDIEFTEDGTGERTFGIKLSGAKSATVTENNILSSADADDKVAISVDKSPDCVVHCNQTDLTQIGLESIFDCYPLWTWGNTFDLHDKAFVQGANLGGTTIVDAAIGDQPDITDYDLGTGNKFTGSTSGGKFHLFSYNDDISQVPVYSYYSGSNPEPNIPQNSGSEQTLCTCLPMSIQDNFLDLNSFYSCNQPIPGFNFNAPIAEDIVHTRLDSDFDDELLNWELKKDLYYFLKQNLLYAEGNSELENFVDTSQGGNIDKFYEVDQLIATMADTSLGIGQKELYRLEAISINNSVDDDFIFETNQKQYNSLFLSTIAGGIYTLSTGQLSTLADITEQCPYHGGSAVFLARGWYTTIDYQATFDDAALCDPSQKLGMVANDADKFSLYPTLTLGRVLLQAKEDIDQDMVVIVNNILGELLQVIPIADNITAIDISAVPSGIYQVLVIANNKIAFVQKVIKVSD